MTDRISSHAPGCWSWGPKHYECAVREIKALREVLQVLVNWTPSADAYRRMGFNPEVPMRAHDAAKALLARRTKTLGSQKGVVAWARPVYARPVNAPETGEWDELVDVEFHTRPEKPEGEGWRPLVLADTGDGAALAKEKSGLTYRRKYET